MHGAHFRQNFGLCEGLEIGHDLGAVDAGASAVFPPERGFLGDDIARRAAINGTDLDGGVGGIETGINVGRLHLLRPLGQIVDQFGGGEDGIDALVCLRRMAFQPGYGRSDGATAFMGVDYLHLRRLPNDQGLGAHGQALEVAREVGGAQAAHFLVIRQREMDRQVQPAGDHFGHQGQGDGRKTLHIRRAPAIQAAVGFRHLERRMGPVLAIHRHHVRVARQHHAAVHHGADGGEQVGLFAAAVVDQGGLHTMAGQIVADEMDQAQVGFPAGGIEGDQTVDHLARRKGLSGHVFFPCWISAQTAS